MAENLPNLMQETDSQDRKHSMTTALSSLRTRAASHPSQGLQLPETFARMGSQLEDQLGLQDNSPHCGTDDG